MPHAEFVTVAVVQNPVEANVVKNYLADAGIKAFLVDYEAISMDWVMANAYGGIKVQVAAGDAEEARAALETKSNAGEQSEVWTSPGAAASMEHVSADDEAEKPLPDRAENAKRAFRAAVFGLLFWPIELYAIYLLIKVYFSREKLIGRPRTLAKLATLIVATFLIAPVVALLVLARVSPGSSDKESPLRGFAHPEVLVGTWREKPARAGNPLGVSMSLRANGDIYYSESGASPVACEGTWAYQDYKFLVRFDRFLKGDRPYKGKLLHIEMKDFRNDEMSMRFGDEWIRMARTQ